MKVPSNITAKVVADSVSLNGVRITTMQLHYPRFIHAEFMTHRMFSRNASSSRAIPITSVNTQVAKMPAMPEHWGQNQAGMQAQQELDLPKRAIAQQEWLFAMDDALTHSSKLADLGCHKQIVNRLTEPFQYINVLVTATEYNNFYWLRKHQDAQPEIRALAEKMFDAQQQSTPIELQYGEWHLPFIELYRDAIAGTLYYLDDKGNHLSLEQAKKISASACAQISYRKNDLSMEKAEMIWDKLITSSPCHASPIEHQATPMQYYKCYDTAAWEPGITHMTADGVLWSGNFRNWIQHRKLIPNETQW